MKHISAIVFMLFIALSGVSAKDRASKHTTVKGDFISVTYGQPAKKGRTIFGDMTPAVSPLVPNNIVWRTGADEATEITFKKDCMFAGQKVKAGTYTLYTIPHSKEWEIILNSKLGQWGAFDYDKLKDMEVLNAKVPVKSIDHVVEVFTITVENTGVKLEWDKTSVFIAAKPI